MDSYEKNKLSHRMGSKKVLLTQAGGMPLKNAEVSVTQKKHKFLFSCAEFKSIPFVNNELDSEGMERMESVFHKFFDLFNYSTIPFYWEEWEPSRELNEIKRLKSAAEWLKSKGCVLKGHPLCWHTLCPSPLLEMTTSQILSELHNRIERVMSNFSGLIDMWDVINEPVIMPVFDKYDNGITRLSKDIGRIGIARETFFAAKKLNPYAKLLVNDFVYTNIDSYEILIEGCLEAGIPIDAIGIQSHMHQGYWGVEKTQHILERFSRFRLPIHFTESTLVSGHNMPQEIIDFNDYIIDNWPSTPDGEERQAREAVLHYKTLFLNPYVDSITWWEFVDGQWLGAPTGFITQDNRVKPIFDEIYKLIKGDWWTSPYSTTTDDLGEFVVSGFYGEYEVACHGKKGAFILEKGNEDAKINISMS